MPEKPPSLLPSLLRMKCPNCRKGNMFSQPSIFPLSGLLKMPDRCPVCKQKFELEVGFYYGTGYVSYGLTVLLIFLLALLFAMTWGLSYKDNSIFYMLGFCVFVTILLQPWLMRISRVIYLYGFVAYGKGSRLKSEE